MPYVGLTARLGAQEINVHDVSGDVVYYGKYADDADDCPYRCIALYQMPIEEFVNRLGRAILDGAVTFSLLKSGDEA